MRKFSPFLFIALLLGAAPTFSDPLSFDEYSDSLGVNVGMASGIGFSYRSLNSHEGWQVTGIAFKQDAGRDSTYLNYFVGAGRIFPLGVFRITDWLDNMFYLQASVESGGTFTVSSHSTKTNVLVGASLSYGLEWLFWDHFSFNFEVATTAAAGYPATSSWASYVEPIVQITPQGAVYFRY